MGIVNLVDGSNVTYGTAFTIGIIASLSTCMAVVGGLVLSMSTTFAKTGDRVKPQMMFHVGRLVPHHTKLLNFNMIHKDDFSTGKTYVSNQGKITQIPDSFLTAEKKN